MSRPAHRIRLEARPGNERNFAGEVEANFVLPTAGERHAHQLVVRVQSMRGNVPPDFGGLWGDRAYYEGTLVVPLARWTMEEVRRYIVNGVVPDHAMP